jgi:hypothetical protein
MQSDLEYHKIRATSELDRGLTAKDTSAARAHLRLASMHMQRVRELAGPGMREKPALQM